jgi:serine/threonine protein kinase
MPQTYGHRWQIEGNLGQGGQSVVFRVFDITGEHQGLFALKRVLNPERHPRFQREIEAIKHLDHPNIINLIDHSALESETTENEKMFLVMPLAQGDLSNPERLAAYKKNLDSVLIVAKHITQALIAAHTTGIIHRDVKPQNILFKGIGHDIWLADFGICLIRENPRGTETGEKVGPRDFMAPELEEGGQLEVTPAADLYSLGKVIYFMLSGGVVIPREQVLAERFWMNFPSGGRYSLLRALLGQMICPLHLRIQDASKVANIIDNIIDWDRNSQLVPMTQVGLSTIARIRQQSIDSVHIEAEKKLAQEQQESTLSVISESFNSWLKGALERSAAQVSQDGVLTCEVRSLTKINDSDRWVVRDNRVFFTRVSGLELLFQRPGDHREHLLQIRLCKNPSTLPSVPTGDILLGMIPYYLNISPHQLPNVNAGYLTARNHIQRNTQMGPRQRQAPRFRLHSSGDPVLLDAVTKTFHNGASIYLSFNASEWPNVVERLKESLTEAIELFFSYVETGAQSIGP